MQFWLCLIDFFFLIFRVTTTNISPGDLSRTRVLLILYLKNAGKIVEHILIHCWTESFPISKQRKLKVFSSINNVRHFVYTLMRSAQSYKHYTERCCPGQVGRWNLIVARGMLKPVYFAVAETMLEFFCFCKLHILHPGSSGPSSKCSFSSALCASLTRLRREPSVSIYKKKMSSGAQGTHFVKSRAHFPKPTSEIISMILLGEAPFWWRQTMWRAFMQIAGSAVAHAHAKKTPVVFSYYFA